MKQINISNVDSYIQYEFRNMEIKTASMYDGPLDSLNTDLYMYFPLTQINTNQYIQNMWGIVHTDFKAEMKKYCFLSLLYKSKPYLVNYIKNIKLRAYYSDVGSLFTTAWESFDVIINDMLTPVRNNNASNTYNNNSSVPIRLYLNDKGSSAKQGYSENKREFNDILSYNITVNSYRTIDYNWFNNDATYRTFSPKSQIWYPISTVNVMNYNTGIEDYDTHTHNYQNELANIYFVNNTKYSNNSTDFEKTISYQMSNDFALRQKTCMHYSSMSFRDVSIFLSNSVVLPFKTESGIPIYTYIDKDGKLHIKGKKLIQYFRWKSYLIDTRLLKYIYVASQQGKCDIFRGVKSDILETDDILSYCRSIGINTNIREDIFLANIINSTYLFQLYTASKKIDIDTDFHSNFVNVFYDFIRQNSIISGVDSDDFINPQYNLYNYTKQIQDTNTLFLYNIYYANKYVSLFNLFGIFNCLTLCSTQTDIDYYKIYLWVPPIYNDFYSPQVITISGSDIPLN